MPAVNQLHIYLKLLIHYSLVNQKQKGMFIYYYSTCICTASFIVSTTRKSSSCAEHLNQHSVPLTLSDKWYVHVICNMLISILSYHLHTHCVPSGTLCSHCLYTRCARKPELFWVLIAISKWCTAVCLIRNSDIFLQNKTAVKLII